VDLVVSQRLGRRLTLRFSVDNLTDSDYLFTQGTEDQRRYKLGRTVALALGLSMF
jgi:outer membrane receptor protein involved in Fe transport